MAKYAKCIAAKNPKEYTVGRVYHVLNTEYGVGDFDVIDDVGARCWQNWHGDIWNKWEPVSYTHAAAEAHNANFPTQRMREDAAYKTEEQETKSMAKYAFNLATDTVKEQPVEVTLELVHSAGSVCLTARIAGSEQFVATFTPGAKPMFHAMYNDEICAAFGIEPGERIG